MNTFDRALELLDQSGWTQFRWLDDESGARLCLGMAMSRARCSIQDCDLLESVIAERYPNRIWGPPAFPGFNDHEDTTEEDVRLVLKLASAIGDWSAAYPGKRAGSI